MSEDPMYNLVGPAVGFQCAAEPTDHLEARRVGIPGTTGAAVAITAVAVEPDFAPEVIGDESRWSTTIVLDPANARRLIGALLHMVDEADGAFTEMLPWDDDEEDD